MKWISPVRSFLLLAVLASSFVCAADVPPTVVTPAAAAPVSVVGKTTQLSVTGADDGGAAALVYAWTATGPAGVTVAPNGTNAAKIANATFTAPGVYTLTGKITDVVNQSVTSAVTVTVVSTTTSLNAVSTGASILNPGQTKTYTSVFSNQFGTVVTAPGPITWSMASGSGSINASGVYTAALPAGVATVRGTSGSLTANAQVQVNAVPTVAQAIQTYVTIPRITQGLPLTVLGADDGGEANLIYTWSVTSGPDGSTAGAAFSLNANNVAKATTLVVSRAGIYTVQARIRDVQDLFVVNSAPLTFSALPITPTITWATPAPITYGTPVSATQRNASASASGTAVTGSFVYSPALGTVLPAGSQALTATFTPTDAVMYATSGATVTLVVQKFVSIVTWTPPAAIPWGTALSSTQFTAASKTPGSFAYTPAAGSKLEVGAQTLHVVFTPSDVANFTVVNLSVPLTVTRAVPSITWIAPNAITWGSPLTSTQLAAVASVPGTLVYTLALGTVLNVGTTTLSVAFTPTDTVHYTGSTATVPLLVQPATPSLTWTPPVGITWGTALSATQLSATSPIPGTPAYAPALGTVLEVGAQTLSVMWNPTDAVHYKAATTTVTLVVGRVTPVVAWPTPSSIASTTPLSATQLNATATVPGAFTYTPSLGATLSAGTQALQAMFTPTDAVHYVSVSAAVSIVVTAAVLPVTGYVTTYVYDNANRLIQRQYDNAASDSFTYDSAGRMLTATSGRYANTVTRSYDAASRLKREALAINGRELEVKSGYDDANRLIKQTYPDTSQVSRDYTNRNELWHIWDGTKAIAARSYDAGGRLQTTQFGNGLTESRTYATGDRMVATISIPGVTDFTYTYDANRLKVSEVDGLAPTQSQYFGYDQADRVTSWKRKTAPAATPVATQDWTLSPVGDWTKTTVSNGGPSTVQNRLHSAVHELVNINGTALLYDRKGNLTQDDQGQRYTWDGENRLASATNLQQGNGESATYAHDALGRRVKKTVSIAGKAVTTYFISAGAQELVEITGDLSAFNDPAADSESAGAAPFNPATGTGARGSLLSDATATRINFQPLTTDTPDGWQADVGMPFPNVTTRGWTAARSGTDREHLGRPLYDSFIPFGTDTWQIPVANGTHAVAIMCGDADSRAQTNHLTVNGVALTDFTPYDGKLTLGYETGSFDGYTATITVTNGLLKITAGSGALAPKICFIEIGAVGSAIDQATADRVHAAAVQATHDTGKPKAKTPPLVKRSFYQSYIDDLAGYTIQRPRHAPQAYWVASNHLFTPAAVTNSSAQVVSRYTYDTFGKQTIRNNVGTIIADDISSTARGFTGYSRCSEVGSYYARARMYSPRLGRFVNRDPTGYIDGMSFYAGYFVPNAVDPEGEKVTVAMMGAGDIMPSLWNGRAQAEFSSRDIDGAVSFILAQLDKNKDGKVDCHDGDPEDVRIIGYSWGGWSAVQIGWRLADEVKDAQKSKNPKYLRLGLLDPVDTLRSGRGSISGNVAYALDIYQQNSSYDPPLAGISFLFRGRPIDGAKNDPVSKDPKYDVENTRRIAEYKKYNRRSPVHPLTRFAPDHIDMHSDIKPPPYPSQILDILSQ